VCELLALSTFEPAELTFSLHTLAAHGSAAGVAHDGWGVAIYQGSDVALFREPSAAAESELVRFLECHGPKTKLAVSHIRHATWGAVQFSNTQPFIREVGGCTHVFAHNGYLTGIDTSVAFALGIDRPVGQTDSERAFCALLLRMRPLWDKAVLPSLDARMTLLAAFAADLRMLGAANFLYADGDAVFAHGHRRLTGLGGSIEPPGLWALRRHRAPADPAPDRRAGVSLDHGDSAAVFIASVPLTDEAWRPLQEGELMAVRDGEVVATRLASPV
jgi:predicted glutamine amidotransferase